MLEEVLPPLMWLRWGSVPLPPADAGVCSRDLIAVGERGLYGKRGVRVRADRHTVVDGLECYLRAVNILNAL